METEPTERTDTMLLQQHYMSHISQDHLMPEHHRNQQTNVPSFSNMNSQQQNALIAAAISLNEGIYTSEKLTSEVTPYYSNSASKIHSSTSGSSFSSSSSSSNDTYYPCSNSSSSEAFNKVNKPSSTPSIGVNLRVTGQCSQGGRKYMEDYFSVAYQQSENAKDLEYAFIGIYDGHGGAEAAKFAKEYLMMEIINQRLFWSDNDNDVLRAIREGYIATHYAMWREQEKWPKTANGLPSTAGTTATIAFIRREKIYIGHVGDSGIVLGYQNENENFWRAKQLTTDHKPESTEERSRIMNSGGKVVIKSGVPRVVWNRPRNSSHRGPIKKKTLVDEIPFLAVARSLGDLWSYNSQYNEFVVSPDPDVKVIPINPNTFRCLIFGTDGLWNVVAAQEAVNTVREKEIMNERLQAQRGDSPHEGNQWTNPSKSLVEQALKTWSVKKMRADNTSVVTVILYPPGQGDHKPNKTADHKDSCALTNPPSFVQPISYGLEFSQMQTEIPAYDDATTYKEMALKYLPPEPFRNFNYYEDDSDTTEAETDESEEEDHDMVTMKETGDLLSNHMRYQQHLHDNNWGNIPDNTTAANQVTDYKFTEADRMVDDEFDVVEEEGEDVDDGSEANERELSIVNYQNYEETNNATDSYINTFTETYNTILTTRNNGECNSSAAECTAATSSSSSSSNSNSNCQSVTPPNGIHALMQEQQLYQQQCMNEEDGYSLTKLETRREQQTLKAPAISQNDTTELQVAQQPFKIFHEASHQTSQPQNPGMAAVYHTNVDERFYQHHQQLMLEISQHQQQKPLELHSLLQQEREEERQVAFERLQMANELAASAQEHQNITTYACLQSAAARQPAEVSEINHTEELNSPMDGYAHALEEDEEYLEEEMTKPPEQTISAVFEADTSVQINEISSSSICNEDSLEIEENDDKYVPHLSGTLNQDPSSPFIEKLENVEILQDVNYPVNPKKLSEDTDTVLNTAKSKCSHLTISKTNKIYIPPPSPLTYTPIKPRFPHTTKRSKSLYPNVPNENLQRISLTNQHSIYSTRKRGGVVERRSICRTSSSGNSTMTPPAATSTPMIQRQLRSTSTQYDLDSLMNSPMDYGKRTLRTRNSLPKDVKPNPSLVQAAVQSALKYPHNAVTRNYIHVTASSIIQGKKIPGILFADSSSNAVRSVGRAIKRNRSGRGINKNKSKDIVEHSSYSLNLRSRQSPSVSTTDTNNTALRTSSSPTDLSSPVIKRGSLSDRRSMRTVRTRLSSSSKGGSTQAAGNFSKSTRSQSVGTTLGAPPPSPKTINDAAAVAAATRARSLVSAKNAAAAGGTQSVVSAIFGKRTSLRRNVSTSTSPSKSNASVASTGTRQTLRGRVVKKLKR